LNLNSISFLAADLGPGAFNHEEQWLGESVTGVALTGIEVEEIGAEIDQLIVECDEDIRSRFLRETPEKLRRIGMHFRAHLGQIPAVAPRCNAPWVSAVIEADGSVRPCFFHRPFGKIDSGTLADIINSGSAVRFRAELNISDNTICRKCVCSLFLDHAGSAELRNKLGSVFPPPPNAAK
jgi:hypothetical protein